MQKCEARDLHGIFAANRGTALAPAATMLWLDQYDQYAMFTVRQGDRCYDLIRLSPQGATTVATFGRLEDAVQRWSELEQSLFELHSTQATGCSGRLQAHIGMSARASEPRES